LVEFHKNVFQNFVHSLTRRIGAITIEEGLRVHSVPRNFKKSNRKKSRGRHQFADIAEVANEQRQDDEFLGEIADFSSCWVVA